MFTSATDVHEANGSIISFNIGCIDIGSSELPESSWQPCNLSASIGECLRLILARAAYLSEYMREAINAKVKQDRKRLREQKRIAAMEMIGKAPCENLFESIEGEDFESR